MRASLFFYCQRSTFTFHPFTGGFSEQRYWDTSIFFLQFFFTSLRIRYTSFCEELCFLTFFFSFPVVPLISPGPLALGILYFGMDCHPSARFFRNYKSPTTRRIFTPLHHPVTLIFQVSLSVLLYLVPSPPILSAKERWLLRVIEYG